jgi:hypothetical protein
MTSYLSVCTIFRNEAPYLREWIEFHRLVGAERFFLYDNNSADDHRQALAPYVQDGTAVVHESPVPFVGVHGRPGVAYAFDQCLRQHGHESRWIAFLDVDEFLFSPTGRPLPELLAEYEQWPGVVVARVEFGTSGHRTRPPGTVIESYLRRRPFQPDSEATFHTIVDPSRTIRALNPHEFTFRDGLPVDENQQPVRSRYSVAASFSRLRINHYRTRSEEEFLQKLSGWEAGGWARGQLRFRRAGILAAGAGGVEDTAISRYVPELREALAARDET